MFHRAKNDTEGSESQTVTKEAQSTQEQNSKPQQVKEKQTMNSSTPETPEKAQENQTNTDNNAQGRVDIPNSNFQRQGATAQTAGQPSRPAYPGTYPGAQGSNPSYAMSSTGGDSDRKLMIGKGITLSGEIEECEHLIVDGTVEATLKGGNVLDISENGAFYGTVEIEEANIAGKFEGDITVSGRLTVQSTGQISGSISYKELAVEVGAVIDGTIGPIGSATANKVSNSKSTSKSKKASADNSAELPFSGSKAAAA